jgi:tripartite-type tricarboxylate transporter receptor subunit TctC
MLVIFPHIYKQLSYNPLQDFVPVTTICSFPFQLTIGPMVPAHVKTLGDFIDWCRANPKLATYGTPGAGSLPHFIGVMLARAAGFEFVHLAYKGGAPAMQDLLGGHIAASIGPNSATLPLIESGNIRALATTGPQRSSRLPDVPTMKEAGYPAIEAVEWFGVFVPANTPSEVVHALYTAIRQALKTDAVKAGFAKLSLEIAVTAPSEFAQLVKSDTEHWGNVVKASGFKPID